MFNLVLILVCLLTGMALQKVKTLPKDTHVAINVIILYLCLPALTILSIPNLQWDVSLLSLVLVGWIIFALAYLFFAKLGKSFNWDRKVIGCLILTAGLGNTSFVGFPVIEALLGAQSLKYAILLDQAGTFLICSTLGIWVCTVYSDRSIPKRELLRRVIVFPPFLSFVFAMILSFCHLAPTGITQNILERFASMLAPLALISVGLQLKVREIKHSFHFIKWGLGFKLILAPIIIFSLYTFMNVPREIFKVAVLEAAMAPMITASILAASYGLEPRLAGLMVGVGVPISFLTLWAWNFFI